VLTVGEVKRLPSGRGLVVEIKGIWYVNVYTPSGAEQRVEREYFFNNELPLIMPVMPVKILMAGDFNCILNTGDSTGNEPRSNALDRLIRGMGLHDVWEMAFTAEACSDTYGSNHYAGFVGWRACTSGDGSTHGFSTTDYRG
jgi:hypothetical protein